ncbi:MAG: glycosyltransferase, partial [Planctomycetota bacterium]
ILAQTFTDFELLALDDGSSDGSHNILKRLAREDSRVLVISRPNTGIVGALNEMAARARGSHLARMDADDIALPDRFETQLKFLAERPKCVCVGGRIEFITEAGQPIESPEPVMGNDNVQREALAGRTPISHPSAMIRRDAFNAAGGYGDDAYPAEDLDLFLRLGEIGELDNVPETVLRYRMHGNSVSVRLSERQIAKMRQACERAWARRRVRGTFDRVIEAKPTTKGSSLIGQNPTASALAGRR